MSKTTSKVSITIPVWALVLLGWIEFFYPNIVSLTFISLSMFFCVFCYTVYFWLYSEAVQKKQVTWAQLKGNKGYDKKSDFYWQIASVLTYTFTLLAGCYNIHLIPLILIYIVTNVFLLTMKVKV